MRHVWIVRYGNVHVITNTVRQDREEAKRKAHDWIGGDPERYEVTPLCGKEDRCHFAITVQV